MVTARFDNQWNKLLFNSNRQLQIAELIELQDLLLNQISNNFNSVYNSIYTVVRGFNLRYLNFDGTQYEYLITEGLIRYKTDYSVYLTVPEQRVFLPINQRSFINLQINQVIKDGNKDPNDGGELYGSVGSPIEHYSVSSAINKDGWPLAIVDTVTENPYVFSFFEKKYEYDYLLNRLPQLFEDFTYRTFYEQSGNFIAKGLELKVSRPNVIAQLRVTEGVAYINGKRVELNSTQYFDLPLSVLNDNEVLYIYLDSNSRIFYRQYLLPQNSPNAFLLGSVLKTGVDYSVRKSKSRSLTVVDLNRLEKLNDSIRSSLIKEALNYRAVNLNYGNLKDTLIEVFSDLSGSDINSFLFSASISTDNRWCSLGKSSNLIELSNSTTPLINEAPINFFSNYIVPEHEDVVLINQNNVTEWITLSNSSVISKGAIKLTPNSSRPAVDTAAFQALYEIEGEINPILNANRIRIEGSGFDNQSNLRITFGSVVITEFTVISGAVASTDNTTFSVTNNGTFVVEFNVPNNLPAQTTTVTVSNQSITSGASYRIISNSGIAPIETDSINLEVVDQAIAQSFTLSDSCILKWIGLFIRNVINNQLKTVAGTVNLVRVINGVPQNESLGRAYINTAEVVTSSDGSLISLFELDNPIYLIPGTYALVISNNIDSMELYTNTVNQPLLNSNTATVSNVDFIDGSLYQYNNGVWVSNQQQDLAFQLVKMSFKQSQVNLPITLINPVNSFSLLNSFIRYIRPAGTTVEVKYKYENQSSFAVLNPNQLLPDKVNRLDLIFELKSDNPNLMPLIDNSSFFITNSFNNEGKWISRTIEMQDYYTSISVELDSYLPQGSNLTVYISSNKGQTWEALSLEKEQLANGAIPLYKQTYSKQLTDTVNFFFNDQSSTFRRKFLTVRVDLESVSLNQNPYFTNLIATTS